MLVLKQVVANPVKNYLSKDLARHCEQSHPSVVVTVLVITLPFAERDNKTILLVSWEDAYVPRRSQNCMQPHEYSISPSFEKFSMDATDPRSFTPFHPVHCSLFPQAKVDRS